MTRHIKCISCGTFNTNKDYCKICGAPLSYKERRKRAHEKAEKQKKSGTLEEQKDNSSFFDKYKSSKNPIIKFIATLFNSIWLGFIAIGTFIAWLFTAIAA